jgi:hypothetical protein
MRLFNGLYIYIFIKMSRFCKCSATAGDYSICVNAINLKDLPNNVNLDLSYGHGAELRIGGTGVLVQIGYKKISQKKMYCDIYTHINNGILTNEGINWTQGIPYYIDSNGKVTDDKENSIIQYCPIRQTKLHYYDVNDEYKQQEESFDKKIYIDMDELKRNVMNGKLDDIENIITFDGEKITIDVSGY